MIRTMRTGITVILMVFILLVPLSVLALDTAPFSLNQGEAIQDSTRDNGRVHPFGPKRSYNGVEASGHWMYQARIDSLMLDLRLFEKSGKGIMFQEKVTKASEGDGLALILRQGNTNGGIMLQADQDALEILEKVHISEIIVVDYDYYIQNVYGVSALMQIRAMLDLKEEEQICVSGLEDPISVVGENGVRRIMTE